MSNAPASNVAAQWFRASEDAGDFMGIRYGRIPEGSEEVEWLFVSHGECDGIGGFARLLREHGAVIPALPATKHPCRGLLGPLWHLWRATRKEKGCADRTDWTPPATNGSGVSRAVAWHLFTEAETDGILAKCRRYQVTVNSFLLKHLDQAIRPEIRRSDRKIPWMIPVNLRGHINHADDTENHVSCVFSQVGPDDSAKEIQEDILRRFGRGEHRANYFYLGLGRFLNHGTKVKILTKDRSKPAGNIGAFSNLGVWDPEKKFATGDSWLFCPPVVAGQLLGAGCVTFRNRLGLAIQGHPGLPSSPGIASRWIQRWVDGIMG
jgi:hypothetical protein